MNNNKNKKGFTLIELLAVLVVLAIIALISIPIVLGIIKSAKIKSEEASVRGYADAVKKAYSLWLIDNLNKSFNEFDYNSVEYTGNSVICDGVTYNNGNIDLDCCQVGNNLNNYYSYENGKVEQYNVCPSKKEYKIGDTFTLQGESYHVIIDSPTTQDYVVALKDLPLTVNEINTYGTTNTNKYSWGATAGYAVNIIGDGSVGGMAYYTSETCGYVSGVGSSNEGCVTDYEQSEVRKVLDNWSSSKFPSKVLKVIDEKSVRLITLSEWSSLTSTYTWVNGDNYSYWMMTPNDDSTVAVWYSPGGSYYVFGSAYAVRPVINAYKNKIVPS